MSLAPVVEVGYRIHHLNKKYHSESTIAGLISLGFVCLLRTAFIVLENILWCYSVLTARNETDSSGFLFLICMLSILAIDAIMFFIFIAENTNRSKGNQVYLVIRNIIEASLIALGIYTSIFLITITIWGLVSNLDPTLIAILGIILCTSFVVCIY
jgi:hypothetical protein